MIQKNPKKIVVTGGHATPALSVLDVLRKRGHKIFWFGEKTAHVGQGAQTLEYQVVPKMGIPFYSISSSKAHRKDIVKTVLNTWRLPLGFFQSLVFLIKIKPDVVLSFGSYVAVPVTVAAKLLEIPVVTHEQTAASGLANRIIEKVATRVAVSFPTSANLFNSKKVVVTGNPIRAGFFKLQKKTSSNIPVLYITGGSRGSRTINRVVADILPDLCTLCRVYHQAGSLDYEEMAAKAGKLPTNLKSRYTLVANYTPEEFEDVLSRATLVISRSGANTVTELAGVGVPAILIPISWSGSNEQKLNAQALVDTGLAQILEEKDLTPKNLLEKIKKMLTNIKEYEANAPVARKMLANPNAAKKVADLVEEVAEK